MFNRRNDGSRTFSRRQLLGGAGAAGAAVAVGVNASSAVAAATDDGSGWQGGVFRGLTSDKSFLLEHVGRSAPVEYVLADDAKVFHGRPATLADFADGEEMTVFVALGEPPVVTEVEFLNRVVDATIDDRDGATLKTDAETLELVAETRSGGGASPAGDLEARPLDELEAGDHIVAIGQRQPNSRTLNVSSVGVVPD